MNVWLYNKDCVDFLATTPPNWVDAIVCDPPYGLEFMGKEWDKLDVRQPFRGEVATPGNPYGRSPVRYASSASYGGARGPEMQKWHEAWCAQAFRVLKPGAYLLAFGGSRTYHRLTSALEDVGFEIRDSLMWLYGTGFPKSLNLDGEWKGWGTALKPAFEPIVMARKPLEGTVAANVQKWGTGALNIDGCRVGTETVATHSRGSNDAFPKRPTERSAAESGRTKDQAEDLDTESGRTGRWPANVILDEEAGALLDAQSGLLKSGVAVQRNGGGQKIGGNGIYTGSNGLTREDTGYGDSGGASRFFYSAKVSRGERDLGCEHLPARTGGEATDREDGSAGTQSPRAGAGRTGGSRNIHPTLKPVALMRHLIRLVTPSKPPATGIVLDPFMGSGSCGIAALLEGFSYVGIEKDTEHGYMEIAKARISAWEKYK